MIRWAAFIVAWCCCAASTGAAEVAVHLRPTVVLAAPRATLADLAELTGPADAVAAIGAVVIQELRSVPVRIDERLVRARLGHQAPNIVLKITGESLVNQPLRTISIDEQVRAATAAIVTSGDDAEVTVQRTSGPLSIADDGSAPRIEASPLDRGRVGEVACRVRLLRGEDELARSLVVLRVRRFSRVAVLTVDVKRGVVLGAGDLMVERVELSTAIQDAITDPAVVLGYLANRDLVAGQVLTAALALPPLAVRPGQGVTMVWRTGTVELAAPGEALAGGKIGDIVGVRRMADQQRVRGQIIGPGQVLMNF